MEMFLYIFSSLDHDWDLLPIIKDFNPETCMDTSENQRLGRVLVHSLIFARTKGWDGSFIENPRILYLPHIKSDYGISEAYIWKQLNNGTTFLASPVVLPWLEEEGYVEEFVINLKPRTGYEQLFDFIKKKALILPYLSKHMKVTGKETSPYWESVCPFHDHTDENNTGTFTISAPKNIFYCFGCHTGGDVITWVARFNNISTLDACYKIAEEEKFSIPEEIKCIIIEDEYARKLEIESPGFKERMAQRKKEMAERRRQLYKENEEPIYDKYDRCPGKNYLSKKLDGKCY